MSDQDQLSLWAPPRAAGEMRRALQARIDAAAAAGQDIADDLALLALSLADRIDQANAGGDRRGFVMLSSEYRACTDRLLGDQPAAGKDPFEAAMAEFEAANPA